MPDDCSNPLPSKIENEKKNGEKNETKDSLSSTKVRGNSLPMIPNYIPKALFPSRLTPERKEASKDEGFLEVFRNVQINIPLLNAIQQIPSYVNF